MFLDPLDSKESYRKIDIAFEVLLRRMEELVQQKPEVTEEWIEEKAKDLLVKANISIHTPEAMRQQLGIIKDFIRSLVEEIPAKRVTVSEEFVEEESYCLEWKDKDELRNELIPKMLKEAGVEVVEK